MHASEAEAKGARAYPDSVHTAGCRPQLQVVRRLRQGIHRGKVQVGLNLDVQHAFGDGLL